MHTSRLTLEYSFFWDLNFIPFICSPKCFVIAPNLWERNNTKIVYMHCYPNASTLNLSFSSKREFSQ